MTRSDVGVYYFHLLYNVSDLGGHVGQRPGRFVWSEEPAVDAALWGSGQL